MNIEATNYYQNPSILPVESDLSPEEEARQREDNLDRVISLKEETEGQKDEQRKNFVAVLAQQSKQTQAEIYLSVAINENVDFSNNKDLMIESLKRTQEQNNVIKAYAMYAENQNSNELKFS